MLTQSFSQPLSFLYAPQPPPPRDKDKRVTVALSGQVFSTAGPGCKSPEPSRCSCPPPPPCAALLFGHPPPRWFIGHTGVKPFQPWGFVCVCVCVLVRGDNACLGGSCICPPTLPPSLPPPHCEPSELWLVEGQPLSRTPEWQTLSVHLFCLSLSGLCRSGGKRRAPEEVPAARRRSESCSWDALGFTCGAPGCSPSEDPASRDSPAAFFLRGWNEMPLFSGALVGLCLVSEAKFSLTFHFSGWSQLQRRENTYFEIRPS